MNKSLVNIIAILILISIMALLISNLAIDFTVKLLLILCIFGIKFLLVAFHFMELKKANSFWKYGVIVMVLLFILASFLLKM